MTLQIDFDTKNNEAWQEGFLLAFKGGASFDFGDYAPLRMQVKATEHGTRPLLDLTDDDGGGLTVEDDGGLGIDVAAADMQDLEGTYVHDIVGTYAGAPVTIAEGIVIVRQGVTIS